MKKLSPLMATFLLAAGAGAQTPTVTTAPAPARRLSLPDAVGIALKKNPTLQAADAYAEAVQQGITAAKSFRYPRLDFAEGFTRGNSPVYVFGTLLTQRQFTASDFGLGFLNTPPPLDNFRTAFTATMPLYDAGQTSRAVRGAKLQAQSAEKGKGRTGQEVVFQVIQAYLNELLAKEGLGVAKSAVETTKSDLNRAQARQESGLAVPSDLLSAQVQLAQAAEDLLQAQNAVELAHAALNVAMGLDEDAPTAIEGNLAELTFSAGSLGERQSQALATRPDYLQSLLGRQQADNGIHMARAEFLPQVNLFSSWETDNQTFASRGGNNWATGVTLNFNLFDGGAKMARLRESKARELQAQAMESQMASAVRLQVREAYLNLATAQERLDVVKDGKAQAAESLRILQNRYEAGLATITDLLRAETAKVNADKNALNAVFDYRLSYAALELATGELSANSPAVNQ
ncbi:MAG: TolC family protein [Terriglobia bacterium]